MITRHDTPKAVLLSFEEFESLSNARSKTLDALSTKFEGLLERLQTPAAREGLEAAFNATPLELGRAAIEAARRRCLLSEGTVVTVFAKDSEATVRLPPALQAELEESLAEADREEGISWDELSRTLQKYD